MSKDKLRITLYDETGRAISKAKGTPDEIGRKVNAWLEKCK